MGARLSTTSAVFWEPPAPYEIQFVIKRDLHDQSHGSETTDWAKAFVDAHQETLFISNKTNVFPMDDKFGILVINEVSTECIGWKTEMLEYLRESGIYVFEDKENGVCFPDGRGNTQRHLGFPSTNRNGTKLSELELKKDGFLTITVEEKSVRLLNVLAKVTELASKWTRHLLKDTFPEDYMFLQYSKKLADHLNISFCLFHAVTIAIIEVRLRRKETTAAV